MACHQRLFDQWRRRRHARCLLRRGHDFAPFGEASAIALNDGVSVQADNLVEEFGAKAIHDAHNDDQRRNAEHHGNKTDRGDKEDKPLALSREQIPPRDHAFIGG